MPLLNVDTSLRAPYERLPDYNYASASEDEDSELDFNDSDGPPAKKKRWWLYLPLLVLIVFMLVPHYSIIIMLVSYYLTIFNSPFLFVTHLFSIYLLTFLACCSLLVCVVRDPGAIRVGEDANGNAKPFSEPGSSSSRHSREQSDGDENEDEDENEETDMLDALRMKPTPAKTSRRGTGEPEAFPDDFNAPHKWCKKCWAPKPERTHHCSACGRCVLKMDHHCPWLAHKCVGYWTYTAFLHFLLCVTLLSTYVGVLAGRIVYVAFNDPFLADERTALHSLFLTLYGAVFALVVGSFFLWHVYLASTNQTTIENISPFLLLRYLPSVSSSSPSALAPASNPVASPIVHTPVFASASLASLTHMKDVADTTSPPPTTPTSVNNFSLNSPTPSRLASLHPGAAGLTPAPETVPMPMPSSNGTSSFSTVTTSIQRTAARNGNEGHPQSIVPYPPSQTEPTSTAPLHEHTLTSSQRRLVRSYASKIRLYDVGFKTNWGQILSVGSLGWRGWVYRALCGGGGAGDGRRWPRNRKAEVLLVRLGEELRGECKLD